MPKRRKPTHRRKPAQRKRRKPVPSSPCPPVPASPEPDPLKKARLQRHADLLEKVRKQQGLNPKEQAELEAYELERSGGPGPVPAGAPVLVSSEAQLAEIYGVGVRTIQTWKAEPGWPGGERGPYRLALIGPWVRARWEAEAKPVAGSLSDQARARRVNAMAEIAEMDLEKRRGELLSRADVYTTFQEFAQAVKTASEAFQAASPAAVAEFQRLLASQRRDLALRYPQPTPSPSAPTAASAPTQTPSAGEANVP